MEAVRDISEPPASWDLLARERRAVVELRRLGRIDDQVMNRIQRDLDLEDARLDIA